MTSAKRLNWKNEIVPRVRQVLQERRQQGVPAATLRGIFYILVSLTLIDNIQQRYKGLSRALVTARREGIIPYAWIIDESRSIIDIDDAYYTPQQRIDTRINWLIELPDIFKDKMIPRWHKQPAYVEVWIEKNAMAALISSILTESRQVRIVPNGGWSSETYVRNNISRIERISKKHDETGVLYFGDYDPTGLRMVRNLERDLKKLDIGFEHVAITKEQIARYGLENLTNPDPTVMAKLRRDSNANDFRAQNNGRLFQIEVDALNALRPEDFVALLEDSVDDHFIPEVYDEVMADPQYSSTSIRRLVRKSIKKFSEYEKAYKDRMKESKKSKK